MDLTHMPPLQSNQKALDVLCEEIIKNIDGTSKAAKAVELTACFSMPSLSTFGEKAGEVGAGDGPAQRVCMHLPCTTLSEQVSASTASFIKFMVQFLFLWLQFQVQVWECVCNQYFRLIRVITIRIMHWIPSGQLPSACSAGSGSHSVSFTLTLHPLTLYWCQMTMMIPLHGWRRGCRSLIR